MAIEYTKAEPAIQRQAWDLIGKQHPGIGGALNKGELVVVFREKAAKSGGQVILGTSRKASPLMNVIAGENIVFIIELPKDEWVDLTLKQREALLDHHLCSCQAEEGKNGNWKFSVIKPPIQAHPDNIKRYGMWWPRDDDEDGDDPVGDMFGGDGGSAEE
jgi:hypothetical protein